MPNYNVKLLYFGTFDALDTVETRRSDAAHNPNITNELETVPGWGPGTTFQKPNLALIDVKQINANDASQARPNNRFLDEDDRQFGVAGVKPDHMEYMRNGKLVNPPIDSHFSWNVEVTTYDSVAGEVTERFELDFIQMANGPQRGDIFAIPSAATEGMLDNKNIVSVKLVSYAKGRSAGVQGNRSIAGSKIVCFTNGTLIRTAQGERRVEDLAAGDMVLTMDMGYQPIRWIGSRKLYIHDFIRCPNFRPIRIRAGALGPGYPAKDLMVSPQHRILVRGRIPRRMFDTDEILVAAKHLVELDGIEIVDGLAELEYYHILMDRHQIVWSNGAASETLYAGGEAIKALPKPQVEQIYRIFPHLRDLVPGNVPADSQFAPVRQFVTGRQGRNLAGRLSRNAQHAYLEDA